MLVGVINLVMVVSRSLVVRRGACDRVRGLDRIAASVRTRLGQGMITRHHVRHVVERLDDVLEGLALRIGAQRGRIDIR